MQKTSLVSHRCTRTRSLLRCTLVTSEAITIIFLLCNFVSCRLLSLQSCVNRTGVLTLTLQATYVCKYDSLDDLRGLCSSISV